MAEDNFIQSVQDATKDAPKSIGWYRNKIREFGKPTPLELIRDGRRATRVSAFNLNDTFPLVLPLERYSDGFLGLNFHYLPIPLRVRLLDKINTIPEDNQYNDGEQLRINYARARTIPMAKAVIKRYLYGHLKSQIRVVTPDEWVIAVLLPVQRFKKASTSRVYNETKKMF